MILSGTMQLALKDYHTEEANWDKPYTALDSASQVLINILPLKNTGCPKISDRVLN